MHRRSLLGLGALLFAEGGLTYTLQDQFDSTNFFQSFNFFSAPDPTNGFVQYLSASEANADSLAGFSDSGVYLGVDSSTTDPTSGRKSVRVTSAKSYTHGLFIADIAHMPSGCGTWPAFWTTNVGTWPNDGEIDIIEGINNQMTDIITLHTGPGCTMASTGSAAGSSLTSANCNAGNANTGCSMTTQAPYGDAFNDIGGGVYATEWTSDAISIWFFPRNAIPADITALTPDPTTWTGPVSKFSGSGCTIDNSFQNHSIIFDTTFCGDWAGEVWTSDAECSSLASTCDAYVAQNPAAFEDAYWLINSVTVYQQ